MARLPPSRRVREMHLRKPFGWSALRYAESVLQPSPGLSAFSGLPWVELFSRNACRFAGSHGMACSTLTELNELDNDPTQGSPLKSGQPWAALHNPYRGKIRARRTRAFRSQVFDVATAPGGSAGASPSRSEQLCIQPPTTRRYHTARALETEGWMATNASNRGPRLVWSNYLPDNGMNSARSSHDLRKPGSAMDDRMSRNFYPARIPCGWPSCWSSCTSISSTVAGLGPSLTSRNTWHDFRSWPHTKGWRPA